MSEQDEIWINSRALESSPRGNWVKAAKHPVFVTRMVTASSLEAFKAENRYLRNVMDLNAAVIHDTLGNHAIGRLCLDEAVSILSEVRSQLRTALVQGGES